MVRTILHLLFGYGLVLWLLVGLSYFVYSIARLLWFSGLKLSVRQRLFIWTFLGAACALVGWLVCEGIVFDWLLGGDPFRGKISGDRYYFGRGGNEFTEVSRSAYWASFVLLMGMRGILAVLIASAAIQFHFARRSQARKKP